MRYRLGKKQNRVVLDSSGHEVATFNKKYAHLSELVCKLLNHINEKKSFKDDIIPICDHVHYCLIKKKKDRTCRKNCRHKSYSNQKSIIKSTY